MNVLWNLDDLYTSFQSEEFLADIELAKKEIGELSSWAGENFASKDNAAEKIATFINRVNNDSKPLRKLAPYCMLVRSVDESNKDAKKYEDIVRNIMSDMAKPDVLFKAYVGSLDNLDSLIASNPVLQEHAFILGEIKAQNAYLLSEKEEVILAKMKNTGSNAWNDMKEQLCATLRIPVTVDGVEKVLPLPAIRNLAHDKNQETRKAAYIAELKSYEQVERAVAAALNSIKGEVVTTVALRGYSSPLDMTLKSSRMEEGTLKAMITAMEEYLPSLRRYFKKKAEVLGHKNGLPWYDLFAPTGEIDLTYNYEEAKELVLEQFYKFSKKLGDYTKHAFDNGWVDDTVREGKRGGAFCVNLHAIGQSRVMLNHDGAFSNVITLAHEFGHAYHGECLKDKTYMNSVYSMPIAETASTFCESIVVDAVLANVDDKTRYAILEQEISKSLQIIIDIYSRYLFELRFFEKRAQGVVSVEDINQLMLQAQKDAYGDGLDPEHLHQYMWVNKPHYYYAARNFYNFPYAYGMMFSSGLYAQYLEQGESFVQKYDDLLAATGSASLEAIGDLAGINVREKDFWLNALKVIESKVDEFCK